jgi:hypothetical protein
MKQKIGLRLGAAACLAFLVAACGGGNGTNSNSNSGDAQVSQPQRADYPVKVMVQAPPGKPDPGYNASGTFTPDESGPAESTAQQLAAPGNVVLTMRPLRGTQFDELDAYIHEASSHRERIKWIYVYDEMFWAPPRIVIGAHEEQITSAALRVKAAGFKSAVTIIPEVILTPGFTLKQPDAFDVILVDVYPTTPLVAELNGCAYNSNPYTNKLFCSMRKLREVGFKGEVWYVFQAFGVRSYPNITDLLVLQKDTIATAHKFGIAGLVSFGMYPIGLFGEPLYPGAGSDIAHLVAYAP